MGAPSLEIIATELFHLGARRFLRVGTSGSMQPGLVRASDYVIATAAVRDDGASRTYAPAEFPAVASVSTVLAAQAAARKLGLRNHSGVVHSKDAFYAREFGHGPLAEEHARYRAMLTAMNTLASEMEASMLFTLRGHFLQQAILNARAGAWTGIEPVLAGAVFLVIGEEDEYTDREAELARATDGLVDLGIETVRQLDALEQAR
jgi:uridine phosphorylase